MLASARAIRDHSAWRSWLTKTAQLKWIRPRPNQIRAATATRTITRTIRFLGDFNRDSMQKMGRAAVQLLRGLPGQAGDLRPGPLLLRAAQRVAAVVLMDDTSYIGPRLAIGRDAVPAIHCGRSGIVGGQGQRQIV